MSRVIFVYERDMPTVSMMRDIFTHAFLKKEVKISFKSLTNITISDIDNNDVLVLIRPNDTLSSDIAKKAKRSGCTVVVYFDDDLLNHRPVAPWRLKGIKSVLINSDVIWSSNRYICERYKKYTTTDRVAVTDTIVDESELEDISSFDETECCGQVRIVYAANPTHVAQFNRYILPIMPRLAERYGKKLEMTFVCVKPELSKYEDRIKIRHVVGMPLHEYRRFMKEQRFDIGLSPLQNNEFTKCKYFNKYIEYTVSGIAGVYSRVEPYTDVIKDRENGFLAYNTEESWYQTICEAIDDETLRKSCVRAARGHLLNDFSQEKIVDRLLKDIPELISVNADRHSCETFTTAKICYILFRLFDWLYLSFYFLTKTGIRGFIDKAKTHIRERKAYRKKGDI